MQIEINNTTTIREVKEQFASCFPYLKIEFLHQPGEATGGSKDTKIADGYSLTYFGLPTSITDASVNILPYMTVGEFERGFKQHFGLETMVCRRQGKKWLPTILTDGLSLAQQNAHGKAFANYTIGTPHTLISNITGHTCKN